MVTDRLLALMRGGHLAEGSKLPPERELAEMLGVSRTIVREALSALQLAGLLERRPGVGTVINRLPAKEVALDDYLQASVSITELTEARMAVELGIVHVLCEPRDYDFSAVRALVDTMRVAVRQDLNAENYILPSLDFHLALAQATEEPVLIAIQQNLIDLMRPHLWLLIEKYDLGLAEKSLELHELILASVAKRDVVSALAAVKSHYLPYPVLTLTGATIHARAGDGATASRGAA
jgi:GntR family transcriptional regulator, transcriptional repressor for pyruvate dehydrogenase complex